MQGNEDFLIHQIRLGATSVATPDLLRGTTSGDAPVGALMTRWGGVVWGRRIWLGPEDVSWNSAVPLIV